MTEESDRKVPQQVVLLNCSQNNYFSISGNKSKVSFLYEMEREREREREKKSREIQQTDKQIHR
jgi:hypothetical protein